MFANTAEFLACESQWVREEEFKLRFCGVRFGVLEILTSS